jgi:hypothetical protein
MNVIDYITITCNQKKSDYRLHPITWKNVIDYNWLRLPHVCHKLPFGQKCHELFVISYSIHANLSDDMFLLLYSWLSLSRTRLTRISGWVEFLSKSQTSLCINIYNLTPVESKFRLSRIKVVVPRCRKPYYLHSLSRIYLSKHVYYLGIKIGSQVKHPVIDFDILTLGYFTFICQIN